MWLKTFCAATLVTFCLFLPAPASAATSATTYTITAEELAALDSRLSLLSEQTRSTRQALDESQKALTASQMELSKLRTESVELKTALQAQDSLLASANKSLSEYAVEEARIRRRIKRQRNTAIGVAACLLLYNLAKHGD